MALFLRDPDKKNVGKPTKSHIFHGGKKCPSEGEKKHHSNIYQPWKWLTETYLPICTKHYGRLARKIKMSRRQSLPLGVHDLVSEIRQIYS